MSLNNEEEFKIVRKLNLYEKDGNCGKNLVEVGWGKLFIMKAVSSTDFTANIFRSITI